ncbi:MAG: glycosyltransferase [Acidobacteriota bacterium]
MKILFLADVQSIYTRGFVDHLVKNNVLVFIFDPEKLTLFDSSLQPIQTFSRPSPILDRIPRIGYLLKMTRLRRVYRCLNDDYDICHVHYVVPFYSDMAKILHGLGDALIVSIWGSDFYKRSTRDRFRLIRLFDEADIITFCDETTRRNFLEFYGDCYDKKTGIYDYGLAPLNQIEMERARDPGWLKEYFGLDSEACVVTVGSGASANHNHQRIIDVLGPISRGLSPQVIFLFPLTYGYKEYKDRIIPQIEQSGLKVKIFSDYLSETDVARLRLVTDIQITMQDTDQMSGAMLEHIFAGSLVITGDWLPYQTLLEKGLDLIRLSSIEDLGACLPEVIGSLARFKDARSNNRGIIKKLYSWESSIHNWIDLYRNMI